MSVYNKKFYNNQELGSLNSAREILPFIINILEPKSVVDVGCGLGTWLSVMKELGVKDIIGLDGNWVEEKRLLIPKEKFIATDLENPVDFNRKFDLVISLEVAEHLNKENAENFIKYLTKLAPVILFSAAIPVQGGTNHINENWQEYWVKLFKENNYQAIDCIRGKFWDNKNIDWWYIQNMFLFVEENYLQKNENIKNLEKNSTHPYSIVHPRLFSNKIDQIKTYQERLSTQGNQCNDKIIEHKKSFDVQIKNYENEIDGLKIQLNYYEEENDCLRKKQKKYADKIREYKEKSDVQDKILKKKLVSIANTKPYRIAYFMRRFSHEFLRGNKEDKKDFLKWIYFKILRKESGLEFKYNYLMNLAKQNEIKLDHEFNYWLNKKI